MNEDLIHTNFTGREVCIYLPPSYATLVEGFPVVYVQDGGYLFREGLSKLKLMMRKKELREVILVGIGSDNRNDEYTPWFAKAATAGFIDFGGQGINYLDFLANELKPYIDGHYRTMCNPENTAIVGASLGGLISIYAAYLHPQVFGRIASISGSFWYEDFIQFMRSTHIVHCGRRIYMDVGALEGTDKKNIQKDMVIKTQQAYEVLLNQGFSLERCRFVIEEGADHEHSLFIRRFPIALQWLFPTFV